MGKQILWRYALECNVIICLFIFFESKNSLAYAFVIFIRLGYHISASWVVLYTLLSAFLDSCNELETINSQSSVSSLPLKYLPAYEKGGSHELLLDGWINKQKATEEYCTNHTSSSKICTYAWMVTIYFCSSSKDYLFVLITSLLNV
jgi:hypothetical protein